MEEDSCRTYRFPISQNLCRLHPRHSGLSGYNLPFDFVFIQFSLMLGLLSRCACLGGPLLHSFPLWGVPEFHVDTSVDISIPCPGLAIESKSYSTELRESGNGRRL